MVNCFTKTIKLGQGIEFGIINNSKDGKITTISAVKARKIIRNGGQGFLAYLINKSQDIVRLEDVRVVKEFPEVFPEELNSLPPDREIEFVIETLPGVMPFSKTPYRMAPVEPKELKEQLQELLDKKFIRPSTSPWGAPVLFV